MKKSSVVFLQTVIVLIGLAVFVLMLWEPHLEGRNAHATLFEIYFTDPFLAYAYFGSIPFFVALAQALKVLSLVGQNRVFSQEAVKAMRNIKYCALITAAAIVGADIYLAVMARVRGGEDDPAGAIMLGMIATFASVVIATAAAVFEKTLQGAVEIKKENDLTV